MQLQPVLQPAPPEPDADVIVIGAGPAGMAATVVLAAAGRRVIVLDMQPAPGGQIYRGLEANLAAAPQTNTLLVALGPAYLAGKDLIHQFRTTPGITYRPDHTVWELRSDGTVGWLHSDQAGYLRAPQILLANGAMERPVPFDGWTLPGVMTAGAVQTLLKAGQMKPSGRVVLAGTGPLLVLLADQLRKLGVDIAMVARTDRLRDQISAIPKLRLAAMPGVLKGLGWLARLRFAGVASLRGVTGLQALGSERLQSVRIRLAKRVVELPCDLLIVHDGIVPATDVAQGAGLQLGWDQSTLCWNPKTQEDGQAMPTPGAALTDGPCRIRISGDARRIGGAEAAIAHGRHAAAAILQDLSGAASTLSAMRRSLAPRAFLDAAFPPGLAATLPGDAAIVCRCEEINAGALRKALRNGARDINDIRGITRCGMGPCQGRSCMITLARMIATTTNQPPQPFRERPPIRPISLGALASLSGTDPRLSQIISLDDKPLVAGPKASTGAADV